MLSQTWPWPVSFTSRPEQQEVENPAPNALGIALTCNCSGKQPQAGLGRGLKGGEGGKGAVGSRQETRASLRVNNSLSVRWVSWLEGLARAGLLWEQAD